MTQDSRYQVLFEPVKIGPVTAPNRFYQVPHASGMTNALPRVRAAFREMKAEGGWGVICTGACSIDPSSDDSPCQSSTPASAPCRCTASLVSAWRAGWCRALARRCLGDEPLQSH